MIVRTHEHGRYALLGGPSLERLDERGADPASPDAWMDSKRMDLPRVAAVSGDRADHADEAVVLVDCSEGKASAHVLDLVDRALEGRPGMRRDFLERGDDDLRRLAQMLGAAQV